MADDVVGALLRALDAADRCREGSTLQAVCVPCWLRVSDAVTAVKATRDPELSRGAPARLSGAERGPHDRLRI